MDYTTVADLNYVDKSLALFHSLREHAKQDQPTVHVLVIGDPDPKHAKVQTDNFKLYYFKDLQNDPIVGAHAKIIIAKYYVKGQTSNSLRWSLKSVFTWYIKNKLQLQKVNYIDSDVYFHGEYQFLIDHLDTYSITLTPHWINPYPRYGNGYEYMYNFTHGLFNAGYMGCGKNSEPVLQWWAEMCGVSCPEDPDGARFADQKYLDAIPIYFENTFIIRHRGCNVAAWNRSFLDRVPVNNKIVIDNKFPIVFIHYSPCTVSQILEGADHLLYGYCHDYFKALNGIRTKLLHQGLGNMISIDLTRMFDEKKLEKYADKKSTKKLPSQKQLSVSNSQDGDIKQL